MHSMCPCPGFCVLILTIAITKRWHLNHSSAKVEISKLGHWEDCLCPHNIAVNDRECKHNIAFRKIDSAREGFVHNYNGVIMGAIASQITNLTIVYSTVHSGADQRKDQSSWLLVTGLFMRGIHRGPVDSPHKLPVLRKMFPFHDVIMP